MGRWLEKVQSSSMQFVAMRCRSSADADVAQPPRQAKPCDEAVEHSAPAGRPRRSAALISAGDRH